MKQFYLAGLSAIMLSASPVLADKTQDALAAFATLNVKPWLDEPVLIDAVRKQNEITKDYDQARIDQLDQEWRGLEENAAAPMIRSVVTGELAEFLRDRKVGSGGAIVEAIVMDAKGLNVAAMEAPSDFWQGDEAKFLNSFGKGVDGVDYGDIELDESSGSYQAQLSYPLVDPDDGTLIGAITVGVVITAVVD